MAEFNLVLIKIAFFQIKMERPKASYFNRVISLAVDFNYSSVVKWYFFYPVHNSKCKNLRRSNEKRNESYANH